jgi:hypothetical protein
MQPSAKNYFEVLPKWQYWNETCWNWVKGSFELKTPLPGIAVICLYPGICARSHEDQHHRARGSESRTRSNGLLCNRINRGLDHCSIFQRFNLEWKNCTLRLLIQSSLASPTATIYVANINIYFINTGVNYLFARRNRSVSMLLLLSLPPSRRVLRFHLYLSALLIIFTTLVIFATPYYYQYACRFVLAGFFRLWNRPWEDTKFPSKRFVFQQGKAFVKR